MKNKAFGLDIGTTSLKAVWLSVEKSGYALEAAATIPATTSNLMSDSAVDHEVIAQTIRKLIEDARITTKYVNIALPETRVYTKVIEMPALSDKELSSAIYYEAEQYISVPLETLTLEYRVLRRVQNNPKMNVLLVGAPTKLVEKYSTVLSGAGLTISSIETETLATIRALSVVQLPVTLVLDIGAISTSLAIVKDGILLFTYTVAIGGAAMTRAIATGFNFSVTQAEEYKKTYGILPVTQPILSSIVAEIKKAVVFYAQRYREEGPIAQIVLSGGSAKLPGLSAYIMQECGIQTGLINPFLPGQQIPQEILDNAPDYALAVGLAMRG